MYISSPYWTHRISRLDRVFRNTPLPLSPLSLCDLSSLNHPSLNPPLFVALRFRSVLPSHRADLRPSSPSTLPSSLIVFLPLKSRLVVWLPSAEHLGQRARLRLAPRIKITNSTSISTSYPPSLLDYTVALPNSHTRRLVPSRLQYPAAAAHRPTYAAVAGATGQPHAPQAACQIWSPLVFHPHLHYYR